MVNKFQQNIIKIYKIIFDKWTKYFHKYVLLGMDFVIWTRVEWFPIFYIRNVLINERGTSHLTSMSNLSIPLISGCICALRYRVYHGYISLVEFIKRRT